MTQRKITNPGEIRQLEISRELQEQLFRIILTYSYNKTTITNAMTNILARIPATLTTAGPSFLVAERGVLLRRTRVVQLHSNHLTRQRG
jgi:hypothetical protein